MGFKQICVLKRYDDDPVRVFHSEAFGGTGFGKHGIFIFENSKLKNKKIEKFIGDKPLFKEGMMWNF